MRIPENPLSGIYRHHIYFNSDYGQHGIFYTETAGRGGIGEIFEPKSIDETNKAEELMDQHNQSDVRGGAVRTAQTLSDILK